MEFGVLVQDDRRASFRANNNNSARNSVCGGPTDLKRNTVGGE